MTATTACHGAHRAAPAAEPMAGMPGMTATEHAAMMMPGAGAESPSAYSAEVRAGYDAVRKATARFKSVDSAVAAGYASSLDVKQCFADSIFGSGGAMGYHHINRAYLDKKVEIDKPEILMYEQTADGKYALTGVEYIVLYRDWPKDSVPPTLMGRPMMHENTRNYWYSHMWIWKPSASGLFADWNPSVKCRAKAGD
jgi:hypothetical protein